MCDMQQCPPRLRAASAISFVITALVASILLVSVVVLLLGELIESHVLAMAIIGVVMAMVSWVIYRRAIAPVFRAVERQIDSIMGFVSTVNSVYRCVVDRVISKILANLG